MAKSEIYRNIEPRSPIPTQTMVADGVKWLAFVRRTREVSSQERLAWFSVFSVQFSVSNDRVLVLISRQTYFHTMTTNFQMAKFYIAVGSKNPVKIQSALAGFELMFPEHQFSAVGVEVASGVSDQPMSCRETLQGAKNRASELKLQVPDADFFVGIEGGIEIINETLYASAWIVIADASGRMTSGRSGSFPLPGKVKRLIESGMELGHANDVVFGRQNSKQQGGAVGSLTGGVITRQSLYEHAMVLALVAFRQEVLYAGGD